MHSCIILSPVFSLSLTHTHNFPYRFLSPANQRVTDSLIDSVYNETNGIYTVKDIKRAAHRYYESRRRLGIEEQPDRQEKAAEQKKRRKYRARQQRSFDRLGVEKWVVTCVIIILLHGGSVYCRSGYL